MWTSCYRRLRVLKNAIYWSCSVAFSGCEESRYLDISRDVTSQCIRDASRRFSGSRVRHPSRLVLSEQFLTVEERCQLVENSRNNVFACGIPLVIGLLKRSPHQVPCGCYTEGPMHNTKTRGTPRRFSIPDRGCPRHRHVWCLKLRLSPSPRPSESAASRVKHHFLLLDNDPSLLAPTHSTPCLAVFVSLTRYAMRANLVEV